MNLAEKIDALEVMLVAGPGGVGKTTTSAAIALLASRRGWQVAVVTVDPARRLADALGIDASADEPHLVHEDPSGGTLWALMLDARRTFDRVIEAQAPSPAQARAITGNRIYQGISGALGGAQEYMAVERLHQIHHDDRFDLIVVDTPPSRQAIDLLGAPDRLVRFLSNPVYRTMTAPSRSFARVTNAASQAFEWAVRRLAGPSIVEDTLVFFRSMTGMEDGFRDRAAEIDAELRADTTGFILVSSPRTEALEESQQLAAGLIDSGFSLSGAILNLVHPDPGALSRLDIGADPDSPLAQQLAAHTMLRDLALAEQHLIDEFRAGIGIPVLSLAMLDEDVHDLDGLSRVADLLDRPPGPASPGVGER